LVQVLFEQEGFLKALNYYGSVYFSCMCRAVQLVLPISAVYVGQITLLFCYHTWEPTLILAQ
jgi:hypothetical protein